MVLRRHAVVGVLVALFGVGSAAAQQEPGPGTATHVICDSGCSSGGGSVTQGTSPWVTSNAQLDIALSALRDAIVGSGPKTLTDVINALSALTVSISGSVAVTGPLTDAQIRATALPVSGSFYQATQPVSIATMPSTPVTGTFWQTTQPVSLASAPTTAVTNASLDGTTLATIDGDIKANVTLHAGTNVIGHVIVDTAPSTAVTNANLDVALSTLATASAQTTGNNSLSTIATNTGLAATAAKQDTGNNSLSSIDGKITAVNTGAVVITSSALPSGAATETGNLAAIAASATILDNVVATPGSAMPTQVSVVGGMDATGTTQMLSTTGTGLLRVQTVASAGLPLQPCNPVRRTNCAPKGF